MVKIGCTVLAVIALALPAVSAEHGLSTQVQAEPLAPVGVGSKFFRTALWHSSGVLYVGTYGPQPAIIWKYDPAKCALEKVAEPGEYQLDSMAEGPDGHIYIGTAYDALVYRLDPATDAVVTLGSPPIDSTTWIFTLMTTRSQMMYGAKGVGLFRLDWQSATFDPIGLVPGNHKTLGPTASEPIIRILTEDSDGVIWGDTNRWLFRFTPDSGTIELIADMAEIEPATYCLFLPHNAIPEGEDVWFCVYQRYGGGELTHVFYRYNRARGAVEPVDIEGFEGKIAGDLAWRSTARGARLLAPVWHNERASIAVIDPASKKVEDWIRSEGTTPAAPIPGTDRYFRSWSELLRLDPDTLQLSVVATNPTPAEARCLAARPPHVLGTDTYDFGHAFTLDLDTMERTDHGKVWEDDHRCNYGPAVFAGEGGRYFIANHSQLMQALWVTDTETRRHWRVGDSASQLHVLSDGTVWGVLGPNPNTLTFDAESWRPRFHSIPGAVFRYAPGADAITVVTTVGEAGPIAEAPDAAGHLLVTRDNALHVYNSDDDTIAHVVALETSLVIMAADPARAVVYALDARDRLWTIQRGGESYSTTLVAGSFGNGDRGFFVLPESGRAVAVAEDGTVTSYDPADRSVTRATGPVPEPAGPAVDPAEDVWYYAGEQAVRYRLEAD